MTFAAALLCVLLTRRMLLSVLSHRLWDGYS